MIFRSATKHAAACLLLFGGVLSSGQALSDSLSELLPPLLKNHNLIKASETDVGSARERVRASRDPYYPNASITAYAGIEDRNVPEADDTKMQPKELDVNLTQRLWDFGETQSSVKIAGLTLDQMRATLVATRQSLILRAVSAYLNVNKASEVLEFARQSEVNIKKQADLEDALVQQGAGLSTDVLQAKTQLAGAQARRVQSRGALQIALNGFRAVFGHQPENIANMVKPKLPIHLMPATIEEAVKVALEENPNIKAATIGNHVARENVRFTRSSSFFPKLDMVADIKYKNNVGGTRHHQREVLGKVQLTFPFDLGFTALNTLKASKGDALSTSSRLADSRDLVEEQVRNAWDNVTTARENAEFLKNQANIAAEFLELAKEKRQGGESSLI